MRVEASFGRCGEAEVYWTGGPEASETAATMLDADTDANTITVDTATGNDVTPVVVVYDARRLLQQRRGTGHKHDDHTKMIIKQERLHPNGHRVALVVRSTASQRFRSPHSQAASRPISSDYGRAACKTRSPCLNCRAATVVLARR